MKNLVAFLFVVCVVVCGYGMSVTYDDALEVTLVSKDAPQEFNGSIIKSGQFYFITTSVEGAKKLEKEIAVEGYVLSFSKDYDVKKFIDYTFSDVVIDGMRVVTGYTSLFNDYRIIDGKKVNVQIAYDEAKIVVGFPLILTGF